MSKPLFSIITPTYNRGHLLNRAIDSVLAQEYPHFEMIIVDDGSTDNTKEVVGQYHDKRIKYHKKDNEERGVARNFGMKESSGEYICFLDSDDIYYPNHLSEAAAYLKNNTKTLFFYQPFEIEYEEGKRIKRQGFNNLSIKRLANNNFLCPIGAFINRDIALNHLFDPDPNFTIAEDLYVWLIIGVRYGIELNDKYTSCLINHDSRSMAHVNPKKLMYCTQKLVSLLEGDKEFSKYPNLIRKVQASHYSLISLYHSMQMEKSNSRYYLIKAFETNPFVIFRRRTIVILKNLLT